MENRHGEVHVSETEASGGRKTNVMRYVLGVSLFLVVVVMTVAWIGPSIF